MFTLIASMITFAFVGAVTPGPVNLVATSTGARAGWNAAMPHVLGASLGYTLVVICAGAGMSLASQLLPTFADAMRYLGGLFLLYMAFKIATAPVDNEVTDSSANRAKSGLFSGALIQILNPKAWIVSLSGISLYVTSQPELGYYLGLFIAVSFICCFAGVSCWALAGHLIGQRLSRPALRRRFNQLMALLLAVAVILMLLE
ncbi:LysE family translocator [Marinobacterium mangrovicola]|uniref:Threonine/homoserine/homoserine lactone efflux protein n=1 Tax=Marinobacterium mangrovicola TaxID=1476959 RepID=A0A4R1GNR2_9GAMM|nr:LysE family translocator [Marinobacterium mangrovicola]TCK08555.1 threonine/homoserine/homoserine lactone efflux protein [Marinobacterium mangrovicola]